MDLVEAKFCITGANAKRALEALQASPDYSAEMQECETLREALRLCGWELKRGDGGYTDIEFTAEGTWDLDAYFEVIAPFVKPGSYIEMTGDHGLLFRYVFNGTTCRQVTPTLVWPEEDEDL